MRVEWESSQYDRRMPALPAGTVTFVFTDIEDSTELLKRLGDGYPEVLSTHRRIIRGAFSSHDGIEIDTQGDAFFFAFPRARDAVAAAVEAQRAHTAADWPGGETVRVRMGLHTGEPAIHEEGYVGLDVVRAARICTVGHGGQTLLSETTRADRLRTPGGGLAVPARTATSAGHRRAGACLRGRDRRCRTRADGRVETPLHCSPCNGGSRRARPRHRARPRGFRYSPRSRHPAAGTSCARKCHRTCNRGHRR